MRRADTPTRRLLIARRDWLDGHLLDAAMTAAYARQEYRAITRGLARLAHVKAEGIKP